MIWRDTYYYLDDGTEVTREVKDHALAVFAHSHPLHGTLHVVGKTLLQDLPKIADVADFSIAMEMVCGITLQSYIPHVTIPLKIIA